MATYRNTARVLNTQYVDVGSVGSAETDLMSYTALANILANDGDSLLVTASGIFANTSSNKTVRVYANADQILGTSPLSFQDTSWQVEIRIVRSSSTNIRSMTIFGSEDTALKYTTRYHDTTFDATTSFIIKLTGQGNANNNVVQKTMQITRLPIFS